MKDRTEIIKTLAEKVMGWHLVKTLAGFPRWDDADGNMTDYHSHAEGKEDFAKAIDGYFHPFLNSADNDALIEAFVSGQGVAYDFSVSFSDMPYEVICAFMLQDEHYRVVVDGDYTTAKKNEAVCMAIYEAVK